MEPWDQQGMMGMGAMRERAALNLEKFIPTHPKGFVAGYVPFKITFI